MSIAVIGGGVMGTAFVQGILRQGLLSPQDIRVHDLVAERCHRLAQEHGVAVAESNLKASEGAEVVILAIKPQNLAEVMAELRGKLDPEQVALSIVAGARMETLRSGLGHDKVVRAMPNTPGQIGQGITIWTATDRVTDGDKQRVGAILGALGQQLFVDDEKYLDMATAVSGSGPAFILLVMEAMIDTAVHLGVPRDMATRMVVETFLGTACLVQQTGRHPVELRNMVTTPGGTAAEGLYQLESGGLRAIIARAIVAAYERSKGLGRANSK
ncbi:MAG TPA: pyrroline-5-carboxylate reductase [Dehalococcoidia bacterium]|nr:pyrroline-5-carboxylate reductase [Dehalococcoidia bacterium]